MPMLTPDPTFYPSPTMATQSPPERFAYLALINPSGTGRADAIGVVDLDPDSNAYGRLVGQTDMPSAGDELHHFGWNACSSCLCPYAPHPHMERRYLVVPGINSSRIHILDTKPDPRQPRTREDDRRGDARQAHRLRRAAHRALRAGGNLHERAWRARRKRPGRHVHPRRRNVRRARTMGARSRTAGARLRHVVAPGPGHDGDEHVGHTKHGEGRSQSRAPARREVRKPDSRLGSAPAAASAGARSRRGAADGARAAAGSRSETRLRVCQRRPVTEGSVLVGVVVVPRHNGKAVQRIGRCLGRQESDRDSCGTGRPGEAAADPPGVQGRRAARDRHRSLG